MDFCEYLISLMVTVISGVLVYVLSELFTETILKPIRSYKELRGKVAKTLVLYANLYSSPISVSKREDIPDWYLQAQDEIREMASEIVAFAETRPIFAFGFIPSKDKLRQASSNLIGISNSMICVDDVFNTGVRNHQWAESTRILLGLEKKPKAPKKPKTPVEKKNRRKIKSCSPKTSSKK